nr:glycosyltransferase [Propionibacterium sp.]
MIPSGERTGVVAVVAAYRPEAGLVANVAAAAAQVDGVVVVDDGSPAGSAEVFAALDAADAVVVRQPANTGIAAALNAGIGVARERWRPEFVLTLDQDSTLGPAYVRWAVDTYRRAVAAGIRVGFVAAEAYGAHPTPTRGRVGGFRRAFDPMQSGSLLPVATLDALGGLDEGFFIDGVDSEYTARAGAAGLAVLVGEGCRLDHALGRREPATFRGRPLRVLGRELSYNYHAPRRVYYMARNGTTLTLRHLRHDPGWVARRLTEESKAHLLRLALGRDRGRLLRALVAGWVDALRGRSGPIDPDLARRL